MVKSKKNRKSRRSREAPAVLSMSLLSTGVRDPFPRTRRHWLHWARRFTSASNVFNEIVLRPSCPNSPYVTSSVDAGSAGSGLSAYDSPAFFSEMMTIYNAFRVHAVRVACTYQASSSGAASRRVGMWFSPNSSMFLAATGGSASAFAQPGIVSDLTSSATEPVCLRASTTPRTLLGIRNVDDVEELKGSTGSAPTVNWYLHLREETLDQATATGSWGFVDIWYDIEFTDRVDPVVAA